MIAKWRWIALACCCVLPGSGAAEEEEVTFFVVADPQVHQEKWGTAGTEATIARLNALPGSPFPGGGLVAEPRGVLVPGDLVDDVAVAEDWRKYREMFDPRGRGLLRFPVYEGIGNHDLDSRQEPGGWSVVQRDFIERNRLREDETLRFDSRHYHYSWRWGPLHLVNLNLFPGNRPRPVYDREAPWNDPRHSLDFLREDLRERVGGSGRPVVLMWHYGLRGWGLEKWWTEQDLEALHEVIREYNVVLILHGHEHSYARYEWRGVPVFMAPSPQSDRDPARPEEESRPKGFLVVRLLGRELQVAHHAADGWREVWQREVELGEPLPAEAPPGG